MHRPTIYLATDSEGFFGQNLMPWETLDIEKLLKCLRAAYETEIITYESIVGGQEVPVGSIVVHSSSQRRGYKKYIEDILIYLSSRGFRLVPSVHAVLSHENKGYQELHKRLCGVNSLDGKYYCGVKSNLVSEQEFPLVFKQAEGFGSTGVYLVRSPLELLKFCQSEKKYTKKEAFLSLRRELGYVARKYVLREKNLRPYGNYFEEQRRFVLQKFIPDLKFDYKVIITSKRCYTLKREVRPNDFRASGSGLFDFVAPPLSLIEYASMLLKKFNEPYLSLDVVFDGNSYWLIEFQGVHFGPYTISHSPFHFLFVNGAWEKTTEHLAIEEVLAESIIDYLQG